MQLGRPSRTAVHGARMRALHLLVDDDPKIFVDPLAALFSDTEDARRVRMLWDALLKPTLTRIRAAFVVRQRFAEDALAEAYGRGVRQYVILGAGLDTFAYRRPPALGDVRVFEVDHPATQAYKRRRLAELNIPVPPDVTFVPVDFEQQSLAAELAAGGFRREEPAFLSWLGVTMYLTPGAVLETFRTVTAGCTPGTGIAFDFLPELSTLTPAARAQVEAVARRVAEQGEPWVGRFEPAALERELKSQGYGAVTALDGPQANARYCAGRTDGLELSAAYGLMTARVGP